MRIGVVADTHSRDLPQQMLADFKEVDLIIHAGDFCSMKDYKIFSRIAEVIGVYGNMDDSRIRELLPRKKIFNVANCQIGLFHGEGPAASILDAIEREFKDDKVDIIIFGHSHNPMNEKRKSTLYFNPGSPNDTVFAPYCSYGILNIENKKIDAQIIRIQ